MVRCNMTQYGGKPAGACTAALFLKSHVKGIEGDEPSVRWAHIDIAGTMEFTRTHPYQEKGMTGRPVRALVEWIDLAEIHVLQLTNLSQVPRTFVQ
ncbi:hypothetical protein CONPUDRAFT_149453 [Coniophora puteana RWD-64-598 SS2]|uniref:Cytosol aminopeptidase domain-containing protein n=1 Tax=Coniophora puteana (strain RWD-64-598) TaxID=741705 RepID=A0A5M3N7L2_CONPW|nr:uncharacterized protein CONPUDRAFT_149453 [Coniophora puteana RWD-64-598 SS2]EIW87423.1 hypothetical protein CONPUDRAFT_149453 [Coniophora puteana RWD-64-598 SS2]